MYYREGVISKSTIASKVHTTSIYIFIHHAQGRAATIGKEDILNQEEQSSRKIDPIGHLAALAPEDVQGLKNTNFTQPMTHN